MFCHIRSFATVALVMGVLLALTGVAGAQYHDGDTINVPGDEPTIQAGLDAAESKDIVLVAAGTYAGVGNRELDFGGKSILLQTTAGAVINLNGQGVRAFEFDDDEDSNAVVDGFTIRNCSIGGTKSGGAMRIRFGAHPTILNCAFENCAAGGDGGAIYVKDMGEDVTMLIENCTFEGNYSDQHGGAIALYDDANAEINGGSFTENRADGAGGAIWVKSGSTLTMNWGDRWVNVAGTWRWVATYTTFEENTSGSSGAGGGAIRIQGGASEAQIGRALFFANECANGNGVLIGQGGAISVEGATLRLENSVLFGNRAKEKGGAISLEGGGSLRMDSCTLTSNSVTKDSPGAIFVKGSSTTFFGYSSLVWNNRGGGSLGKQIRISTSSTGQVSHCCIQDLPTTGLDDVEENTSKNPDLQSDGWHIGPDGSCLGAGKSNSSVNWRLDIDGDDRVIYNRKPGIDIGADEIPQ